MLSDFI